MSPADRILVSLRFRCLLIAATIWAATCGGASPLAPGPVTTPPVTTPPVTTPPVTLPPPTPPTPPTPTPPPTLGVTRILCFGDSLTAGYLSPAGVLTVRAIADSYPTQLQQLLGARYTGQTIRVENAGLFGEWADDGQERIVPILESMRPDAVVLLEGVNDLNALGPRGVNVALAALENMLRDARARGARVLVASLPPQRPDPGSAGGVALVNELNAGIRSLASRQSVLFVDVNAGFGGNLSLLGADGLHPTTAGYQRIAQTVFDTLRANFEQAPGPTPTAARPTHATH